MRLRPQSVSISGVIIKIKQLLQRHLKFIGPAVVGIGVFGGILYAHAATPPPKPQQPAIVSSSAHKKIVASKPVTAAPSTTTVPKAATSTPTNKPATTPTVATVAPVITPAVAPQPVVTPAPTSSVSGLTPTAPATPDPTPTTTQTPPTTTSSYTSTNWSGYLSTANGNYTAVSGAWNVPHVTGNGRSTSADSSWIGIGGVSSGDLIQVGTQDTVLANGQVSSSAFYEILPAVSQNIPSMTVSAGDAMTASIIEISSGQWSVSITDLTTNQNFTTTLAYTSTHSSAEWIEEDPSYSNNHLVPFDNFGTVSFTNSSAIANGSSINLIAGQAQPIILVNRLGTPIATPTPINSDGASFTVNQNGTN